MAADATRVELVHTTGRPIAEIARELGIYDSTLGNWALDSFAPQRVGPWFLRR